MIKQKRGSWFNVEREYTDSPTLKLSVNWMLIFSLETAGKGLCCSWIVEGLPTNKLVYLSNCG